MLKFLLKGKGIVSVVNKLDFCLLPSLTGDTRLSELPSRGYSHGGCPELLCVKGPSSLASASSPLPWRGAAGSASQGGRAGCRSGSGSGMCTEDAELCETSLTLRASPTAEATRM